MDIQSVIKDLHYKVLVNCMTYNQSAYIEDALNGFVMQQTNFPFVCLVMDDASTDGEQEIIRAFLSRECDVTAAKSYDIDEAEVILLPHNNNKNCTLAVYFLKKNLYGTPKKKQLIKEWKKNCKYIALCEGDDYWTCSHKLQKQVVFLEAHDEYSMCFHAAEIKNYSSSEKSILCENIEEREYFANDFYPEWVIPTASVVYRSASEEAFPPLKHIEWQLYGDIVLFLQCAQVGRIWGMKEKMSVYRMTESGAVRTLQRDPSIFERKCRHCDFLMINFPQLDKEWPNKYIAKYYYRRFLDTGFHKGKLNNLFIAMSHSPRYVFGVIVEAFGRRFRKMFSN